MKVQTVFLDGAREQRLVEFDGPPLVSTGDGKLVIGMRDPAPQDWVNGLFVGDHDEPEENEPHVHGRP